MACFLTAKSRPSSRCKSDLWRIGSQGISRQIGLLFLRKWTHNSMVVDTEHPFAGKPARRIGEAVWKGLQANSLPERYALQAVCIQIAAETALYAEVSHL